MRWGGAYGPICHYGSVFTHDKPDPFWPMKGAIILVPLWGQKMALPGVELDMTDWLHSWSQNGSSLALCVPSLWDSYFLRPCDTVCVNISVVFSRFQKREKSLIQHKTTEILRKPQKPWDKLCHMVSKVSKSMSIKVKVVLWGNVSYNCPNPLQSLRYLYSSADQCSPGSPFNLLKYYQSPLAAGCWNIWLALAESKLFSQSVVFGQRFKVIEPMVWAGEAVTN